MGARSAVVLGLFCLLAFASTGRADASLLLEATFESGLPGSGEGTCVGQNTWSGGADDGVDPGSARIFPNANCVFLDTDSPPPPPGLATQKLHFLDTTTDGSTTLFENFDLSAGGSSVYWIDFLFNMDGVASGNLDGLQTIIFRDNANREFMRLSLGQFNSVFRYKVTVQGTSVLANDIASISTTQKWRALIRIDLNDKTQTHWLWLDEELVEDPLFGERLGFTTSTAGDPDVPGNELPKDFRFITPNEGAGNPIHVVDFNLDNVRVTSDALPLNVPVALKAVPFRESGVTDGVRLTWTNLSSGEDGFKVERALAGSGSWTELPTGAPAGATEYFDAFSFTPREKYDYRVAATYPDGSSSPWTNVSSSVHVFRDKPFHNWIDVSTYVPDQATPLQTAQGIQTAINMIPLDPLGGFDAFRGPKVVYFPNGSYEVDQTLYLEARAGVQFIGESPGGVILKWVGGPGPGPDQPAVLFHGEGNREVTWRNIIWDGGCDPAQRPDTCWVVAFDNSFCGKPGDGERPLDPADDLCNNLPWPEDPDAGFGDTAGAFYDSEFRNAWVGLRIGHFQVQNDSITVRRCVFRNNFAGASIEDFNALRIWFWDSRFEGNYVGVTNDIDFTTRQLDPGYNPGTCLTDPGSPPASCLLNSDCPGDCDGTGTCVEFSEISCSIDADCPGKCSHFRAWAGDYDVLRGRFIGNENSDTWAQPTGVFGIRDSWSTGSGRFFHAFGPNSTSRFFSLVKNQVEDSSGVVIDTRSPGPFLFAGNEVITEDPPVEAPLSHVSNAASPPLGNIDVVSYDNTYTLPQGPYVPVDDPATPGVIEGPHDFPCDPIEDPCPGGVGARLRSALDGSMPHPGQSVVVPPPLPVGNDPLQGRPVYTVTEAALIQDVIDAALVDPEAAIVHFPGPTVDSRWAVSETLTVPAGNDIALIGDGPWTRLRWAGPGSGPILEIDSAGASDILVRDLQFNLGGILVHNVSDGGKPAYVNQVKISEGHKVDVLVHSLEDVGVDFIDFLPGGNLSSSNPMASNVGLQVKVSAETVPLKKPIVVWTGVALGNEWDFDVINDEAGADVLVQGVYMEDSLHYLRARSADPLNPAPGGRVTVTGAKMASIVPVEVLNGPPIDPTLLPEKTSLVSIEDFSGNVSILESTIFVQRGGFPLPSADEAADFRGRIRVTGDTPVTVQAIGLGLRDADLLLPEYEFSSAQNVSYVRLATNDESGPSLQADDLRVSVDAAGTLTTQPVPPTEDVQADLDQALAMLLEPALPPHYDEVSDYKVKIDRVFLWSLPDYGIALISGQACLSTAECDDGIACTDDLCDRAGLQDPAIPGNCLHTPVDTVCDDGVSCTVDTCDPAGGCLNTPDAATCDDGVVCTIDSCDAVNDCINLPDDASCDNGLFCDGLETCTASGCQPGADPCPGEVCDEIGDVCTPCGNGICDPVEDCSICPADCISDPGGVCGNGVCEPSIGEDCLSCAADCRGKQNGNPNKQFCCGDGAGNNPVHCDDFRCVSNGFQCSNTPSGGYCCGDGTCEGAEDSGNCGVDCGFCGDDTCDLGENPCNCANDCGSPPVTETVCDNGLDDDCDGATDCADGDCAQACQPAGCDNDGTCEPDEDCDNCPNDCDGKSNGPRSGRYCCGNGVAEGAEGDGTICDGNY